MNHPPRFFHPQRQSQRGNGFILPTFFRGDEIWLEVESRSLAPGGGGGELDLERYVKDKAAVVVSEGQVEGKGEACLGRKADGVDGKGVVEGGLWDDVVAEISGAVAEGRNSKFFGRDDM